jgi:hypothetical protein
MNTGTPPLNPKIRVTLRSGASSENSPPPMMFPPSMTVSSSVSAYNAAQPPTTSERNPKSLPNRRSAGPKPQSPGLRRPHV